MALHRRRDVLKTLPALAVGLSGCSRLPGFGGDDDSLPTPTAWRYRLQNPTPAVRPGGGPLVVGSRSPFSDDPVMTGVDPDTGEEQWTVTGGKGRGSPVSSDDRFAYAFSKAEEAFAVDYRTGEVAWEVAVGGIDRADPGVVQFAPVPVGDSVVLPVSGVEDDVTDRLVALGVADGERRASRDLPASLSGAPAGDGEGVVAPLLDGTLRRVTLDGTEQWRVDVGASMSSVTVADGTAYVGSATEQLLAFDAETGERKWSAPLENTVFTRPLVADGRVFVGAADYYLYGFDAATGKRRWRTETDNAVTSGPVLADGKLVTLVGTDVRERGTSGTAPFSPTVMYVHRTDGTLVDEYRFEGYSSGGEVAWVTAVGDAVYLGQAWRLVRLAGEVLDDG